MSIWSLLTIFATWNILAETLLAFSTAEYGKKIDKGDYHDPVGEKFDPFSEPFEQKWPPKGMICKFQFGEPGEETEKQWQSLDHTVQHPTLTNEKSRKVPLVSNKLDDKVREFERSSGSSLELERGQVKGSPKRQQSMIPRNSTIRRGIKEPPPIKQSPSPIVKDEKWEESIFKHYQNKAKMERERELKELSKLEIVQKRKKQYEDMVKKHAKKQQEFQQKMLAKGKQLIKEKEKQSREVLEKLDEQFENLMKPPKTIVHSPKPASKPPLTGQSQMTIRKPSHGDIKFTPVNQPLVHFKNIKDALDQLGSLKIDEGSRKAAVDFIINGKHLNDQYSEISKALQKLVNHNKTDLAATILKHSELGKNMLLVSLGLPPPITKVNQLQDPSPWARICDATLIANRGPNLQNICTNPLIKQLKQINK